jgi:acetoin utilization deacetylase AcuC-like enzyme
MGSFCLDGGWRIGAILPDVSIPVIASELHRGHDGLVELLDGRPIPCFESPARVEAILGELTRDPAFEIEVAVEHGIDPIAAVHDLELIDLLEHVWTDALEAGVTDGRRPLIPDTFRTAEYVRGHVPAGLPGERPKRLGAYCFDTATPIVAGSHAAARGAVDVALSAMQRVVGGVPLAFGACRPPGHHAGRNLFGGYCFFNNAAIVAERLLTLGAARVAILDLDFHHGNGTQQIFWERGEVLYVSVHGDPRAAYPYFSGHADEVGAGAGAGATRNLPLPPGSDIGVYRTALDDALEVVAGFDADAPLVISLGLDTHEDDPISDLALRTEDYTAIGARVGELRQPAAVLLEGGYAIDALGPSAARFLRALHGELVDER